MFNFTFLNSGILVALGAIVIPLLIHLFAKKKPRRIVFSSIKFIQQSVRRQNKRINLKNLLLILIRTLIVLLTILAVSRPALELAGLKKSRKHPPTSVVFIVDNSYSMDYVSDSKTEFDHALEALRHINGLLDQDDVTAVVTLDEQWNRANAHITHGPVPEKTLRSLRITPLALTFEQALNKANDLLAESQLPNREIYFITDGQHQPMPAKSEHPVFILPTTGETIRSNLSCMNARVERDLSVRSRQVRVDFEVVNHSPNPQQDVICRLIVDGQTEAELLTRLEPGQTKTESFVFDILQPGWHEGYVEVVNERQPYDNRSYFAFNQIFAPRIGVIAPSGNLPIAVLSLLEVFGGEEGQIEYLPGDPTSSDLIAMDVVLVYKSPYSGRLRFLFEQMEKDGRGLLFIADSEVDRDWFEFLGSRTGLIPADLYAGKPRPVVRANRNHPVTRVISEDRLRRTAVSDCWEGNITGSNTEVLLSTSVSPIALQSGRMIVWLFDPASLKSSFLLDSSFPVFAFRCLQEVSGTALIQGTKIVGERMSTRRETIVVPGGDRISPDTRGFLLSLTGVYKVEGGDMTRWVAVNLDYGESEWKPIDAKQHPGYRWLKPGKSNWENEILRTRYGFEIWKYLLIGVLLLFGLEMLLVRRTETRSKPDQPGTGE